MRGSIILMLLVLVGCASRLPEPELSEADAEAIAAGMGRESQIRFFITDQLRLDSLDLTHTGQGNFTAQGMRGDGTEFDIKIVQESGKVHYNWKNSKGRQGKGLLSY